MGRKWVKNVFSKSDPGPFGMPKQVFLAHFESVVTHFGTWKIPKYLENGSFWDQKRVKNGSKTCFLKSDPEPVGMLKQVFLAHFEPLGTGFGPWKIPKCQSCGQRRPLVKNGPATSCRGWGGGGQNFCPILVAFFEFPASF